jgi:tetratricopeptide (TPR) repeat protein
MKFCRTIPILAAVFLLFAASRVHAQDAQPESSSKPASPPNDRTPKSPAKQNSKQKKDTAAQNASDQPAWDPLRAEKDLEVGQYYMKKGDLDAAIDRFQDATAAKPGYAIPFRFLAEAQEKKGLKRQAIKSYQRYLDLYSHAEDGDKVRKKIDKLYKDIQRENK